MSAPTDVLADLRKLANVGEYHELREAMQGCLRPHERAGFADVLQRMEANLAAVAELIAADDEYDAAVTAHKELIRRVAEQGWYEIEFDALRNAGVRTIRAQARRADALARVGGAA